MSGWGVEGDGGSIREDRERGEEGMSKRTAQTLPSKQKRPRGGTLFLGLWCFSACPCSGAVAAWSATSKAQDAFNKRNKKQQKMQGHLQPERTYLDRRCLLPQALPCPLAYVPVNG